MRLKEYGRNPNKRIEYVYQPDLLLVGVDVSKAKHRACMGTQTTMSCRKLEFPHTREGFKRFKQPLRVHMVKTGGQRILIVMEPCALYRQALYERRKSCDYEVCLVHCQAVRNNRKTRQDGTSKTDENDAASVFNLLRQGKFFLPIEHDAELKAAYRMMRHHMALKKRVSQRRHQLRAAIHLAFPELKPLVKALTQPTALRFLQANPTPEAVLRNGRTPFVEKWQPRHRCGQWRPETFPCLYDLAQTSIGLQDPYRIDEFEITTLAGDLVEALTKQQLWLDKAINLLAHRMDYQLLLQLPTVIQQKNAGFPGPLV